MYNKGAVASDQRYIHPQRLEDTCPVASILSNRSSYPTPSRGPGMLLSDDPAQARARSTGAVCVCPTARTNDPTKSSVSGGTEAVAQPCAPLNMRFVGGFGAVSKKLSMDGQMHLLVSGTEMQE